MRTPPLHEQPALTKSPKIQSCCWSSSTKLYKMPEKIDPRKVVGGKVHALSWNVTSEAESKRVYGSKWKTATVNGTVIEVNKRGKDNSKTVQTYVNASYMFPNEVSRSKEFHLKSVKKFWPTDEPATTAVPPQLPDERTIEPPNPPQAPPAQWESPTLVPQQQQDSNTNLSSSCTWENWNVSTSIWYSLFVFAL